jgi:hypothetical protein
MIYISWYILLGIILSVIFDILNEFVLHPIDKLNFDWFTRIINIIIWPHILGVFISTYFRNR